jgi:hypothetical protein
LQRYAQQYWGIRYIDDSAARRRVDGQNSSLYISITDGQFSTVAVLGESANLLERVSYLAYGLAAHQWPGDFDGDGYVGTSDESHLYSTGAYKSVLGDPEYDADFDLNRDGRIDEDDLILGQVHLGRGPLGGGAGGSAIRWGRTTQSGTAAPSSTPRRGCCWRGTNGFRRTGLMEEEAAGPAAVEPARPAR